MEPPKRLFGPLLRPLSVCLALRIVGGRKESDGRKQEGENALIPLIHRAFLLSFRLECDKSRGIVVIARGNVAKRRRDQRFQKYCLQGLLASTALI